MVNNLFFIKIIAFLCFLTISNNINAQSKNNALEHQELYNQIAHLSS